MYVTRTTDAEYGDIRHGALTLAWRHRRVRQVLRTATIETAYNEDRVTTEEFNK
jgi:hypothetical protein